MTVFSQSTSAAAAFDLVRVDPLNVVAVEVIAGATPRRQPLGFGLPDDLFEHRSGTHAAHHGVLSGFFDEFAAIHPAVYVAIEKFQNFLGKVAGF